MNIYPEALKWAQEKGLTMLANSDVHGSINDGYDLEVSHRPVTLVFATERKAESIKYALENQSTAVYFENQLVGDRKFLTPLFNASVKILSDDLRLEDKMGRFMQIHNSSDIDFILKSKQTAVAFTYKKDAVLKVHRTSIIEVNGTSEEIKNQPQLKLEYDVTNLIVAPGECLQVVFEVDNLKKMKSGVFCTAFH